LQQELPTTNSRLLEVRRVSCQRASVTFSDAAIERIQDRGLPPDNRYWHRKSFLGPDLPQQEANFLAKCSMRVANAACFRASANISAHNRRKQ
jgi:hypothetical protein